MTKHHVQLSVRWSLNIIKEDSDDDFLDSSDVVHEEGTWAQWGKSVTSCNWQNWSKCTHAIFAPFKYVTFEDDGADVDNDNGDHDDDGDDEHLQQLIK